MKKLLAVALAVVMLFGIVSIASAEEPVVLKVASIWSAESETNRAPMLKTVEEFNKQYEGKIQLDVQYYEANEWKDLGETLALSDSLPDVFYWNAGGVLKGLVDSGDILDLTPYLTDEIKDRLIGGALANMTFDDKVYQLPYTNACSCLYCNTKMFEENGVKVPETWDELVEAVKAFKAKGITPMALGGGDKWPTNMYTDIIALRFVGDEACRACYYKTEGATFKTQDWIDGMAAFKTLIDEGAFADDAISTTRDESEVPFWAEEIPMYVHGQWFAGSLRNEERDMTDHVVAVKFPAVGKGYDNQWMGGPAEGFSAAAYTQHPEEAFIACQFLAENQSKNGFIAGAGLPAWKYEFSAEDLANINPVMAQIADAVGQGDSLLLWGNTALSGNDASLIGDTVYDLLVGKITPEEWCDEMETIFE